MGLFGKKKDKDKGKNSEAEAPQEDVTVRISNSRVPPLNLRGLFPEKIRGKVFEVNEQGGTVGSLPENTIPIQDTQKSVSRTHCRILFSQSDMCYHIADLNSSNGTSLTTDKSTFKLSPQTYFQLKSGFIIHIGVEVQLIVAEDKSAAPAPQNANANYVLQQQGGEAEGARAPPAGTGSMGRPGGAPGGPGAMGPGAMGPGGAPMGMGSPGMQPGGVPPGGGYGMAPGGGAPGYGAPAPGGSMAYSSMAYGPQPGMGGPGMAPMASTYGAYNVPAPAPYEEPQFVSATPVDFSVGNVYNPGQPQSFYESPSPYGAPAPYSAYPAPTPYGASANPYQSVSTAAVDDELAATLAGLGMPGMGGGAGGMPPMGMGAPMGMPPAKPAAGGAGAPPDSLMSMAGGGGQGKLKAYYNNPNGQKPVQRINLLQYTSTPQAIAAILQSFGLVNGRVRYKDADNDEIDMDAGTDYDDIVSYAQSIQVYPN